MLTRGRILIVTDAIFLALCIFRFPKCETSGMVKLLWESDGRRANAPCSFYSSMI